MSKICEVCGKAPSAGRNVSHSHRVTNRWFRPNIQRVTIKDKEGHVRKANVCTKCMKSKAKITVPQTEILVEPLMRFMKS